MRDEVNAMQNIVSKASNDYQFLQQELVNLNTRISAVEKHAVNSEFILQGLERALVDYQKQVGAQNDAAQDQKAAPQDNAYLAPELTN